MVDQTAGRSEIGAKAIARSREMGDFVTSEVHRPGHRGAIGRADLDGRAPNGEKPC